MVFLKKAFPSLRNKGSQAAHTHTCADVSTLLQQLVDTHRHSSEHQDRHPSSAPGPSWAVAICPAQLLSHGVRCLGEAVAQDQKGWLLQAQPALQMVRTSGNKWLCNILHHPERIYPHINLYKHTYFSTWMGIYIGHSQINPSHLFPW